MSGKWKALREGKAMNGFFLSMGSPITAEVAGGAGFDFTVMDLEHGMGGETNILPQLQAISSFGTAVVVRVESHEPQRVHRILDLGAHGIMFPRVNNAEQAHRAIQAMRYPPHGMRGVATIVRASNYGEHFDAYRDASREQLLSVLQIETPEGVANVAGIAAVEGVDVLFIGPYDLTQGMGIFRQFDHPRFIEAVEKTVAAARANNRALGILLPSPADFGRYYELGFRFITCGSDLGILVSGTKKAAQELAEARGAY